jgi:hypothetical protein
MLRIALAGLGAVLVAVVGSASPRAGPIVARAPAALVLQQQPADQIAFVSDRDGDADIYLVSAAGGAPTNLTGGPDDGAQDAGPAWSPDGARLAFASTRAGTWDLYVLTLADMTVQRITRSPATEFDPAWSPDGATLAFETTTRDGARDVASVAASGGPITNLTDDGAIDLDPVWDGDAGVVFTSDREGSFDTYTVSRRGGIPKPLRSGNGEKFHLATAPDRSAVAFERGDDGNYDLYLFDRGTATARPLTDSPAEDSEPSWSPAGDRLAFTSGRDGQYEIYVVSLATSETTRLTSSAAGEDFMPAWRPVAQAAGAALATPPVAHAAKRIRCDWSGNSHANTKHGGNGASTLCGGGGNDRLYGERGNDRLVGDSGKDRLYGNSGSDKLYGGTGSSGSGSDRLRGGEHSDRLYARGDRARDCVWGNSGAADWARLDIGTSSRSDNRNPAPFGGNPCGERATIEALD